MENIREPVQSQYSIKLNTKQFLNTFLKRGIDITFSLMGLLFLWPFFLFVAIRIKKEDPGPVFYRGERAGVGGRTFKILKFRTMYERPESYQGARVTAADDDRVTPLGRWLRDTKLNELPQLLNVLKGDMSIIGPRPEIIQQYEYYSDNIAGYRLRKLIPQGITGWAQINFPHSSTIEGNTEKLKLDLYYIRNISFKTDFIIIYKTFLLIIKGRISKFKY